MSSPETRFQPMTTGMLLDRSFRIYFQNFALMIGIGAFAYLPLLVFNLIDVLAAQVADLVRALVAVALVIPFLVVFVLATLLATGATTKAVSEKYLGNPVTVGAALQEAWRHVGPLFVAQLVAQLIVTVGFLLLIIPGILWLLSYALIAPVAILEASNSREIRQRSWELVDGNRGKVLAVLFVVGFMQLLLTFSGGAFVAGVGLDVESSLGSAVLVALDSVLGILGYPLWTIAVTLLYYDLRIRKEGFDLEMLSRAINPSTLEA